MLHKSLLALAGIVIVLIASLCRAEQRVALVIGNGDYPAELRLRNPSKDADAMESALQGLGFSVIKKKDLDLPHMEEAVVAFRRMLTKGSLGLFFYAGHGVQVKGENYLVPIGARMREEFEVKRQCLDVSQVLDAMGESESSLKVVVLDCCRDNPFKRGWSRSSSVKGLASISDVPEGTLIAFATAPNATAADGSDDNSPYTEQLVTSLRSRPTGGLELSEVFREASRAVKRQTGQVPWLNLEASLEKYYLWGGESSPQGHHAPPIASSSPARAAPRLNWRVQSGEPGSWSADENRLAADGSSRGWLFSEKEYADFELRLEYKLAEGANSGVTIRSPWCAGESAAKDPSFQGIEIQIMDDGNAQGAPGWPSGSIWNVVASAQTASRPAGQWNSMAIVARGRRVSVVLNGVQVLDANLDDYSDRAEQFPGLMRKQGFIGLQSWVGAVEFRNVTIKPLQQP